MRKATQENLRVGLYLALITGFRKCLCREHFDEKWLLLQTFLKRLIPTSQHFRLIMPIFIFKCFAIFSLSVAMASRRERNHMSDRRLFKKVNGKGFP